MSTTIIDAIRAHLTGDVEAQMANATGETAPKTRSALTSGAYAAMAGLIGRGATMEGAQGLLSSLKSPPSGIGILGDYSDELVGAVASSSGTNRASAAHVLGFIAPIAAGILGRHVLSGGLDARGLSSMLMGQKQALLADPNLPPALGSFLEGTSARRDVSVSNAPGRALVSPKPHKTRWGLIAALGLGALALLGGLFISGRRDKVTVPHVETPVAQAPEMSKPEMPAPELPKVAPPTEPEGKTTITSGEMEAPKNKDAMSENFAQGKSFLLPDVNFASATTQMLEGGEATIDCLAGVMNANPTARIRLDGYTDSVGSAEVNAPLSRDRAESVKKMLVAKGIDEGRIETGAQGASSPIGTNDTHEGRQQNRRVEVTVLSR